MGKKTDFNPHHDDSPSQLRYERLEVLEVVEAGDEGGVVGDALLADVDVAAAPLHATEVQGLEVHQLAAALRH